MDPSFGAPDKLTDIILLPVLFTILGIVVWFLGWGAKQNLGRFPMWHWAAFVLWGLGLIVGGRFLWNVLEMFNPNAIFYVKTIFNNRIYYAHIGAPIIPLLPVIILGGWQWWDARQDKLSRVDRS